MSLPTFTHPEIEIEKLKEKGVSLVAFCDNVRKRKDETCTIRIRVVYQRVPMYYTTKINLTEEDYLRLVETNVRGDLRTKKVIILKLLKKAYDIIIDMEQFSFEEFGEEFTNKKSNDKINVYNWYDQKIFELKKDKSLGNLITYDYSLKSLKDFTGEDETLIFNKITPAFLKKYEEWMLANDKSRTTVGIYLRPLRHLFNRAIRDSKNKQVSSKDYPFALKDEKDKYRIPTPRNIKKALTKVDLKKIFEYVPIDGSTEHFCLDIWLFSYLCNGINMKDICRLKYSNIKGDSIEFFRAKTANTTSDPKPISIVYSEKVKEIVNRWGVKPVQSSSYIFPFLTEGLNAETEQSKIKGATKQVNKYIKRITEKLSIDVNVSTYTARHSFATILKNSGVPVSFIGEQLGHSTGKVTEKYLASFEQKEKEKIVSTLTNFD